MSATDVDNTALKARVRRFLPQRPDDQREASADTKIWAVSYSEADGGETYLGAIVAEDDRDAFVKARSLLLPEESAEEVRVRLWSGERTKERACRR